MSLSIGKQLEARGWLQGSIIDKEHCRTLLEHATLIDVDLGVFQDSCHSLFKY